jgi:transcriptional repressor NrdR
MKCPKCGHLEDKVVDSRTTKEGGAIRRRRECLDCAGRFTTYEYIEKTPLMVVKKDGRREPYNREKLLSGLRKACEKRPVSHDQLEKLIDDVEAAALSKFRSEIPSVELGNVIIERLKALDGVAYVRFASVYRQFRDVNEFMDEIKSIVDRQSGK